MTQITLVAAIDQNNAIGQYNQLPWHLPDDLRRFKQRTLGKPVVMGRKTAESIGRALPLRTNIILSRSPWQCQESQVHAHSLDEVLALHLPELIVIGGEQIYQLFLSHADQLWITHVETKINQADAYFPKIDPSHWKMISEQQQTANRKNPFALRFVDYIRRTE
jgi:dihydrofolate reductase